MTSDSLSVKANEKQNKIKPGETKAIAGGTCTCIGILRKRTADNSKTAKTAYFLAFDNGTSLVFDFSYVYPYRDKCFHFYLKVRTLKSGKKDCSFGEVKYRNFTNEGVRTRMPYRMADQLLPFLSRKDGESYSGNYKLVPSIWKKRMSKLIDSFLVKNGVEIKYLPKDPFGKMTIACYPGYEIADKARLHILPALKYAKGDLTKNLLKTNGTATRNSLIQLFNKIPGHQLKKSCLLAARVINHFVSVDDARKFLMQDRIALTAAHFEVCFEASDRGLLVNYLENFKFFSQFKHYSKIRFLEWFNADNYQLTRDTINMLRMFPLDRGIPVIPANLEHHSIQELHDKLIPLIPKKKKKNEPDFHFSDFIEIGDFIHAAKEFRPDWEIVTPLCRHELQTWGQYMRNCIASYATSVHAAKCSLVAIKKNNEMIYNLEFVRSSIALPSGWKILPHLVQVCGKYNQETDVEDAVSLVQICGKANINIENPHGFPREFPLNPLQHII